MPQIDFDGANSLVKTDKIQGQSGTTVTVPTGHPVAITDADRLTIAGTAVKAGALGKVGQVVQIAKTDTYTETIGANTMSTTNVTGMSVTITPSATSSKVFIMASIITGRTSNDDNSGVGVQLVRGTTLIGIGDAASNRTRVSAMSAHQSDVTVSTVPISFLDSPSSTSAQTYHIRFLNSDGDSSTIALNRSGGDSDSVPYGRGCSTITALEILA